MHRFILTNFKLHYGSNTDIKDKDEADMNSRVNTGFSQDRLDN